MTDLVNNIRTGIRNAYELLRSPDRQPKCYDMTDTERAAAIMRLNRNVWNDPTLAPLDGAEDK